MRQQKLMEKHSVSFSQDDISDNILEFEVANSIQLSENMAFSEPIYVQNLPWKIGVQTHVEGSVKYVGCFVKCDSKSKSTTWWSCQAKVEVRMINHDDANKTISRKFCKFYDSERHQWGWKQFMEWNKVIEPDAGFLNNNTISFELILNADTAKGLNPNIPKICDTIAVGMPTTLKTSGAIFFLAIKKQCDTLRFCIYFAGSALQAKHYEYTLSITDSKTGKPKYVFHGEVFTLDKDDPVKGSVFMMGTEGAKKMCGENSKFDVNITIRNLKEEAMDEDESSGVSD